MMTPAAILPNVKAAPFRPFRIHAASGRTFEVRRPEMVKIGKTHLIVLYSGGETPDVFDEWESVSLMLIESISHMEAPVS